MHLVDNIKSECKIIPVTKSTTQTETTSPK